MGDVSDSENPTFEHMSDDDIVALGSELRTKIALRHADREAISAAIRSLEDEEGALLRLWTKKLNARTHERGALHERIKAACAEASPRIAAAATGTEAAIYHLPLVVADMLAELVNDGRVVDALERKGITVSVRRPSPRKFS